MHLLPKSRFFFLQNNENLINVDCSQRIATHHTYKKIKFDSKYFLKSACVCTLKQNYIFLSKLLFTKPKFLRNVKNYVQN